MRVEDGQLLLAGCLFSGNNDLSGGGLQVSGESNLVVLSYCQGDSYNAGQGALQCAGSCSTTYPADLLSGECTTCPALDPYSCCGALYEGDCTTTKSSVCSEDENYVCSALPASISAPSIAPTLLFLPVSATSVPTSLHVLTSSSSATFIALVVLSSTAAVLVAIIIRWCFTQRTRYYSSKRTGNTKEDMASPFLQTLNLFAC